MILRALLAALLVALLLGSLGAGAHPAPAAHHLPAAGDRFAYSEVAVVGNGTGNYTGYQDGTFTNGSISVSGVLPNQTAAAYYSNNNSWRDNQGDAEHWSSSGSFTFSPVTFRYVSGTDNQTGYTRPYVWFYIDNTLGTGGRFVLLNTPMSVVTTNASFPVGVTSTGYARTLFGEGNGSYQRNDSYGLFTASYTWKAFFDPATGYIVGYVYTEQDRDASGNGFDLIDRLVVTSTSYPLTAAAAPPPPTSGSSSDLLLYVLLAVVVVVLVLIVVVVLARRSRRRSLPQHSAGGRVPYAPPPGGPPPPAIHLTPSDQPAVQQVVVREEVKVNCRYCGALVSPGTPTCPRCGAPLG